MTQYNGHAGDKTENRIGRKRREEIFKISYTTRERLEDYLRNERKKDLIRQARYLSYESAQEMKKIIQDEYRYDDLDTLINILLDNKRLEEGD